MVLDYPRFYDLAASCVGLSTDSRTAIDGGIDALASTAAAARHGFVFADVRAAFTGHEICDSNRWLHSVNITQFGESHHPTADGHSQAYLPTFAAKA